MIATIHYSTFNLEIVERLTLGARDLAERAAALKIRRATGRRLCHRLSVLYIPCSELDFGQKFNGLAIV
jgi:hypothetical protein